MSEIKCEGNCERKSMLAICQDGESLMFIAGIICISQLQFSYYINQDKLGVSGDLCFLPYLAISVCKIPKHSNVNFPV